MRSSRVIFVKLCRISSHCSRISGLNFGVDPTQNGRGAAIFDFHYPVLHITYFFICIRQIAPLLFALAEIMYSSETFCLCSRMFDIVRKSAL